jgi:hypothetical protein
MVAVFIGEVYRKCAASSASSLQRQQYLDSVEKVPLL